MINIDLESCSHLLKRRDMFIDSECEKFIHRARYKGEVFIDVDEFRSILCHGYNQAVMDINNIDKFYIDEEDNEDE